MSDTQDNWSIRPISVDFGQEFGGHAHWADHLTVVTRGPVRVDWRDEDGTTGSQVLDRGDSLLIPAPRFHTFTALHERGAEWRCIFNYADAVSQGITDRELFDKSN
jgi:quercetin dioxygenase-like cupin family protein